MTTQTRLTFNTDTPRPGTPAWVLQEITHPTTTTRREAHLHTCPHCAAPTLTGYDNDTAGIPTTADPILIPTHLIPAYNLTGRPIYHLENTGTTYRLHTVHTDTPGPLTLIPAHACHHPPPGQPLLTPPPTPDPNQEPPF